MPITSIPSDLVQSTNFYSCKDHIAFGADFHARVKWEPGTVVVWDNRVTQHSALVDWASGERRHLARITPQAEPPYETAFET